jgi:predicted Fe-Mo cluster-binding NifX family protein
MKIAIAAQGENLDASIDARFGRAKGFIIYDDTSDEFSYVDNKQNLQAMQGAGIQSARTVIDTGAGVLLSGNVGPKAFATLQTAGVDIYLCTDGSVREALEAYKRGELPLIPGANVEGHW